MAELHLHFGPDGYPIDFEFERLHLNDGDLVVVYVPRHYPHDWYGEAMKHLSEALTTLDLMNVKVIMVVNDLRIEKLDDDELTRLGLQRIWPR